MHLYLFYKGITTENHFDEKTQFILKNSIQEIKILLVILRCLKQTSS